MRDHMDPELGRALERHFADLVATTPKGRTGAVEATPPAARGRAAWATVVVALVVVIGTAFAIRAGQQSAPPADSRPSTAAPSTSAPASASLLSELPEQPSGRTVHTWQDTDASSTTGPFDLVGSTAVIAAVCDGGGAIAITDTRGAVHRESCARLDVQQPFWRFDLGGDRKPTTTTGPVRVTVRVLSGTPRYVVRLWAVDPRILDAGHVRVAATSDTVPRTLRTCTAADLAPTGTVERSTGIVTITSRATTDCAIRSWPTLRFRSAAGRSIGPVWGEDDNGRSVDPAEGALNEYGEFPPARLAAHGSAYLIVSLVSERELQQEDARRRTVPTPTAGPSIPPVPTCDPVRAASVRLTIGTAAVAVPTPEADDVAACTTASRVFTVTPVVTTRPAANG